MPRTFGHLSIEEQFSKAYARALKYLSYRPRSKKEIEVFLAKKEFDPLVIIKAIELLSEQKLLNDKEFSNWWIEQRQNYRSKGKVIIKHELRQKGIDEDIIEDTFLTAKDDYQTAKELLSRKHMKFKGYTGKEYKQKVAGFLQRRGFSWETVHRVLKNEYDD